MNKTKQFKRTAFPLSAKSMVGTLLLLIAMLMPQGAWATDFISEIKVSVHEKNGETARNKLSNDGYQIVNVDGAADLNGGGGGYYVYIGYKTSTNAADAITGLLIVESATGFDAHSINYITNAITYNGKNYYRCANYDAGDARLDCDLNRGRTGNPDIVLFYTKEGNNVNGGTPLTSISVVNNTTTTGVTYTRHWKHGTAQNGTSDADVYGNTNDGCKSPHYITYTTHTHAYTAAFNWATNGKSCTATTNCAGCGDTHSNLACTVTDAPKSGAAATCTVMGWTTYTAKVTSNGKDFSATKDVQDIAALGHSYGAGSWSWADDGHSATCTRTCGRTGCTTNTTGHTSSKSVTFGNGITSAQQVNPTCTTMGTTRYTATATVEGTQYSATKDVVDIAALGHSYGAGAWSWADDGHSATCTRTCSNDANHKSSASVTLGNGITSEQQGAPNCTTKGTTRYTATATVEGTQYNATKDVVDIAALGHLWHDDRQDLCDRCSHTFIYYEHTSKAGLRLTRLYDNEENTIYAKHTYDTNTKKGIVEVEGVVVKIGILFDDVTFVTIPHTVKSLSETFWNCKNLNTVTLYPGLEEIGHRTFQGSDLQSITIPSTVTNIGMYAFSGCSNLKNLTLPHSLESIGSAAFMESGNLVSLEMQSIPLMGDGAFLFVRNCAKTVVLSDDSYVYKESNPDFPAVASVTAPCTLDLTGSVVENHANLTLNHGNSIVDAAVAATCTTDGLTEGSHCNLCGKPFVAQTIIPATGHTFTNNTLTPIEDGLYAYACDNGCGAHTDDHIIKDFNGEGNHLELTKDGEGNYSTSEDIIINESDFYYSPVDFSLPVDFTAASVTFNRYFVNDGGMYSFIVPFDIPAAQAAELGKFYQYSKHEEGKVYFDDITKIDNADGIVRANTAYFFEPAKDIPSITVENPTFGTTGTMPDATNPSEPGLYGTYSQIDIPVGAYGYMMQHGVSTFVKADTGNLLRPFRAYLWLGSGASMANARAFFGDYDVDAIEFIGADDLDLNAPIYNLQGQRITTPKKGEIYIQNGKKVMKK